MTDREKTTFKLATQIYTTLDPTHAALKRLLIHSHRTALYRLYYNRSGQCLGGSK
jgi:hypothetical protein